MGNETPVLLRTSERSTFRDCVQKWQWSYLWGLEAKRHRGALTFGTMIHVALAEYYVPGLKRGPHPAETFARLYDENVTDEFSQWDDEGNKVDARTLGIAMLTGYIEEYGDDSYYEILYPEMTFRIDLYDPKGNYLCTYVGSIDGVGRDIRTGRIVLFEHKTAKSIKIVRVNSQYGEQGLSYWWAATKWLRHEGLMGEDEMVDEVIYNFLRKGMPDERPVDPDTGWRLNKPKKDQLQAECEGEGLETKGTMEVLTHRLMEAGWTQHDIEMLGEPAARQPAPLFERQVKPYGPNELRAFEDRLMKQAWHMNQVRDGKIPVYKSPGEACDWKCDLKDVCEVHEMGGDWKSMMELDFKKWDPYEDHRLLLERA